MSLTLAAFKRRLSVGSKVLHVSSTFRGIINELYTVSKTQTNGVYFLTPGGLDMWCDFPKAKDLIETADGFIIKRQMGQSVYKWA